DPLVTGVQTCALPILQVDCSSGDKTVIGSHVLLAVGRVPNTNDLGVEHAGIKVDKRGYIQVDDQLRTNVPGIYALGDCNGRGARSEERRVGKGGETSG